MNNINFSIVIPVYNCALLIERCLDSIFQQYGDYNKDVIVIDDGSTDNSVAIVNNYPAPIKLIQQANQGPAAARNKGIEAATGKYLAFLDADDYWKPEFLKTTVTFLEAHPDVVAVSTGQMHNIIGKPPIIAPQLLQSDTEKIKDAMVLEDFYAFWAAHNHVCTGSVLMRTDIVKQTGGQRPELRITEDLEFWAYLATFGKWGFIPKVLFVSDGGAVTKSQGWWVKNKKRWASAPTVEDWESRIIERVPENRMCSFRRARGRIAKNLAYAMILSQRQELARQTTVKYKNNYPKDKIARLMVTFAQSKAFWAILTQVLYLRERFKKL